MTQDEMAVKLIEVEQRAKSNSHRLDEAEKRMNDMHRLTTAMEVIATKQEAVSESVDRLENKVDALEAKPAKRWDGMIDKIFYTLVGAVVAALGAGLIHLLAAP